jgi:cyclic pyranopterin monophosphate synthase
MDDLTHLDAAGHARMVDVSDREVTVRTATAVGLVVTTPEVLNAIATGSVAKGDVAALARVAGILGAKRTPDLVPLCHPIALHGVEVHVEVADVGVRLTATARTADRTGVEMEALTAIAVAGLTVIDMIKSLDPAARITDVQLEAKDGGRSGSWRREDSA